jgi:shikimate dehydrogenase
MIKGSTKVVALIGDPVEKSLSPPIHNEAFRSLKLDYVYVAFRVPRELLPKAVEAVKTLGIAGLNVTIPHKVAIVSLLDALDRSASLVGAVNTVKNDGGKLVGYNTDGIGALKVLEERVGNLTGKRVLLLGAGGAARAISFALAEKGVSLTIANRTIGRAKELAVDLERKLGVRPKVIGIKPWMLSQALKETDILINATAVGMYPRIKETLVTGKMMHPNLIVFDIVYQPLYTRLLREAREIGAKVITGLEMLVNQAALSFEIWTGKQAPVELMRHVAWRLARGWRFSL